MILPNGISVYVIAPDASITQEMVNISTSESKDSMPSKTSNSVLYRVLETITPVHSSLINYQVYRKCEIGSAWENL